MEYKICGVTGHRPKRFPWNYYEKNNQAHQDYLQTMEYETVKLIVEKGYDYFICGGALGVDTDFAEIVLRLRDTRFPHIKIEIAVPCSNQEIKWSRDEKERYYNILKHADFVTVLAKRYTCFYMQKRNEYIVNKSNYMLAFWNGERKGGTWNTIQYIEKKNHPFDIIPIFHFTEDYKQVDAYLSTLFNHQKNLIKKDHPQNADDLFDL